MILNDSLFRFFEGRGKTDHMLNSISQLPEKQQESLYDSLGHSYHILPLLITEQIKLFVHMLWTLFDFEAHRIHMLLMQLLNVMYVCLCTFY